MKRISTLLMGICIFTNAHAYDDYLIEKFKEDLVNMNEYLSNAQTKITNYYKEGGTGPDDGNDDSPLFGLMCEEADAFLYQLKVLRGKYAFQREHLGEDTINEVKYQVKNNIKNRAEFYNQRAKYYADERSLGTWDYELAMKTCPTPIDFTKYD